MPVKDNSPDANRVPRHIAIIMDGNGRWANARHLPRAAGHKAGVNAVENIVSQCAKRGIELLTLFAFSSENWRRPEEEVGLLMSLFVSALENQLRRLHENNIRFKVIGDRSAFNAMLRRRIEEGERMTAENSGLTVNVAVNYGGRWDITQAIKVIAHRVAKGEIDASNISSEDVEAQLCLGSLPKPDFFIRTGGEQRISNFLLWQLAYTELYFTDVLWPDFDEERLCEALDSYAARQRRFGRTSEQVLEMVPR